MEDSGRGRTARIVASLALVLLCLAVFFPVLDAQLLSWDDGLNLTHNPLYHPLRAGHLVRFWQGPWSGVYAPVTYSFWAAEVYLAERLPDSEGPGSWNAGLFHAGNLVLHLLGVLASWRLLARLIDDSGAAWWAAAVLAVHPLRVESVAWVTETKGLLAALFSTLALLAYLNGCAASGSRRLARRWLVLSGWAFVLALLSKPSAVALPLAIAGLALSGRRPTAKELVGLLVGCSAWALAMALVTWKAQASALTGPALGWGERCLVTADALGFYGQKLLWPWPLAPDYGRTPAVVLAQGWTLAAMLAVLLLALVAGVPSLRRWALPAVLVLLAGVGPNLGWVPFEFQRFSTVADRYFYWALLGPAWLLGIGLAHLPRAGRHLVGAVLTLGCAWISHTAVWPWTNDATLYSHTAQVNPRSTLAWNGLGNVAAQRGDDATAAACYRRVLELEPHHAAAGLNLANVLAARGQLDEALAQLALVLEAEPGYVKARRRLADFQQAAGDWASAEQTLRQVLNAVPDDQATQRSLGQVLARLDRTAEAIEVLTALADRSAEPGPANDLAWLLATAGDEQVRNPQQALAWAQRAIERAGQLSANLLDTLAAAQAAAGQFDQAQASADEAWQLAQSLRDAALAERIDHRRQLYRQQQAYVESREP